MNRTNLGLLSMLLAAGGIVYYVHHTQTSERERMRRGPINDVKRRQQQRSLAEGASA